MTRERQEDVTMATTTGMPTITETARAFFDACETGNGWQAC
jgi:hypothetical protein